MLSMSSNASFGVLVGALLTTGTVRNGFAQTSHHGITVTSSTESAQCGGCHAKTFNEWRHGTGWDLDNGTDGSYHSLSATLDVFQRMLADTAVETRPFCQGCHEAANIWAVADKINDIPVPRTENVAEGTNCVTCHYDGSRLIGGADLQNPLFCATCHNDGSGTVNTFDDWQYNYQGTETCQDCHVTGKGHIFPGAHSTSFSTDAIEIQRLHAPCKVHAHSPYRVEFELANNGAGHSVPSSILKSIDVQVSFVDSSGRVVRLDKHTYYKRSPFFGEDPTQTDVFEAGETKSYSLKQVFHRAGVYTMKIELIQNLNRFGYEDKTVAMGSAYRTIEVR